MQNKSVEINPRPAAALTREGNSDIIISIHPRSQSGMTHLKRSLMKKRRNLALGALLIIGLAMLSGWATSTRHVDMRFLKDGISLSGHSLEVLGAKEGMEAEVFKIAQDGWVRLPSSYVGKNGACRIKDGDLSHEFMELGFSRGKTTLNFTHSGIESEHAYRFLFYDRRTETKPLPFNKNSEQGDAVQPATAVESNAEGNEKSKPESEGRSQ